MGKISHRLNHVKLNMLTAFCSLNAGLPFMVYVCIRISEYTIEILVIAA